MSSTPLFPATFPKKSLKSIIILPFSIQGETDVFSKILEQTKIHFLKDKELKQNGEYLGRFGVNSAVDEFVANKGIEMNQLDDNRLNPIGGITNSRKFNIWWGEFYFQKQEWTERKEQGGFVQWRKELRHG